MVGSDTRILVTGASGFIGASVLSRLASKYSGASGIDNFSEYYDSRIKRKHIEALKIDSLITNVDICEIDRLEDVYRRVQPEVVIHLAAQGGVRASQLNPEPYIQTNQMGFLNVLNLNNTYGVETLIYASSSSVYGEGLPTPFSEEMQLPGPKSLYAASKVADELMARSFPCSPNHLRIGLRFFTVYGPWGRPDMAVSRLLASGYKERPFVLTANLELVRDFTYVEDVTDVIEDLLQTGRIESGHHTLINVAGEAPRSMGELIKICESKGIPINVAKGEINLLDVAKTHGSSEKLAALGVRVPKTRLENGIAMTAAWMAEISNSGLVELLD